MSDTEEARKKWLSEQSSYERFAQLVSDRVKVAVQGNGIWCETSGRAKDVPSLVKKLLKGKHSYDTLPDKAGARCVVRYLSDLTVAVTLAQDLFACSEPDDKLRERQDNQVGYISIHLEVRLKPGDEQIDEFPPDRYCAELQIRTLAQHVWAEMAHDSVYKNDESLAKLPIDIKRRVNLMAGQLEVADREFDRLNKELILEPAIDVYKTLESYYFRLTSRRPDTDLSLTVINALLPLYGDDVKRVIESVTTFFNTHRDELANAYSHTDDSKASAFFYQPEALMILERLESDEFEMRRVWNEYFPESELERVANAIGMSLD